MLSRSHILAILPRGETMRNFVYTGALDRVAEDAELSILSVNPDKAVWDMLQQRFANLHLLEFFEEKWPPRFAREVLDMAHGRYIWSAAAKERWYFRDYEANTLLKKTKRFGKKCIARAFASKDGLETLSRYERNLSHRFKTTTYYTELYQKIKPDLVFNASHVHSRVAMQAVQAAQWLGIPTATFVFSWDNLTSQGRIMPPYDYHFVWNEAIKAQLLEIYPRIREENVFVSGTPQFDNHFKPEYHWSREEFFREVKADPTRPLVFYATGMPNHMPGEEVIIENIADMLGKMEEQPQLLVRVYPKDTTGRFDSLQAKRPDILFPKIPWEASWQTPKPEDAFLLANTLRHCAFGINIASTVSLELCMFDKPALNVGYNPPGVNIEPVDFRRYYSFDHYKPLVDSGTVQLADSEETLFTFMQEALKQPDRYSANRKAFIKNMFGDTLDGNSGIRVAEKLLDLVSQTQPVNA